MSKFLSGNPAYMRDINRAAVLDAVRRRGPISQAELSKLLSLQPSTILRVVTDLIQENLVRQTGKSKAGSSGGRRAVLLELNADGAMAVGVDLGADEIIAVLLNLAGDVVDEIRLDTPNEQGPEAVMAAVKHAISQLLDRNKLTDGTMKGIGISVPGKVDSGSGVSIYAANLHQWHNVAVGERLTKAFGCPVHVEHDMRSMALGEMWFREEQRNMLCLGFRRGIGLGIVLNGELYQGSNQFAGDLGHITVDPNGPLCSCGRNGCLEVLSSEGAILLKARQLSGSRGDSEPMTLQKVYEALNQGDPDIIEIVKEASGYIGRVLSDLVRILDPDKIVIGGDLIAYSTPFLDSIRDYFVRCQPSYAHNIPDIEASKYGNRSIAIGSSVLVLARLFRPGAEVSVEELS